MFLSVGDSEAVILQMFDADGHLDPASAVAYFRASMPGWRARDRYNTVIGALLRKGWATNQGGRFELTSVGFAVAEAVEAVAAGK
jgi:hypothetical protein